MSAELVCWFLVLTSCRNQDNGQTGILLAQLSILIMST